MAGAHGHRGALARPDDGALLQHDVQRTEGAFVLGDVGVEQEGKGHRHGGLRVGEGGIDEAGHLRIGIRQVHRDVAALLGDMGADDDVGAVEAVVVERGLAVIDRRRPRTRRWCVRDVPRRRASLRRPRPASLPPNSAITAFRRCSPSRAAPICAARSPRKSRGWRTFSASISSRSSRSTPFSVRRIGGMRRPSCQISVARGVVGAMRRAADIGVMRAHHRPEHQRGAGEHRHEGGQVGQVGTAAIRVVQQVDVAAATGRESASASALAAQGMAPTCTGMWSACATSRHRASISATEKSREEFRICE